MERLGEMGLSLAPQVEEKKEEEAAKSTTAETSTETETLAENEEQPGESAT